MQPLKNVTVTFNIPVLASNNISAKTEAMLALSSIDEEDGDFFVTDIETLKQLPEDWHDQLPINSEDLRTCKEYTTDYIRWKQEEEDKRQMKWDCLLE